MNTLFIVLSLVSLAFGAHAAPPMAKENGKHKVPEPIPTPLNKSVLLGNDELAFYEFEGLSFLVAGEQTTFTTVNNNGTCVRVDADEDAGSVCPLLNQTLCDTIAASVCEPAIANFTCSGPSVAVKNGNGNGEDKGNGNGYRHGGPLCHIAVGGKKMQPSAESMFVFLQDNQIKACHFEVAPAPRPANGADKLHHKGRH